MNYTYLGHSAFLLETETHLLLFDHTKDTPKLPSDTKPLLVFSSHRHSDHYNPVIFSLAEREGPTVFVLSSDIASTDIPFSCTINPMGPYEEDIVEGLVVKTLKSTDEGVAFVVEAEGKTIYFAGDLNHWHWEGESEQYNAQMAEAYHKELTLLPRHLDLAFVPVDPRLGPFYSLGAKELVNHVSVDTLIPMHTWEDYTVCSRLEHEIGNLVGKVIQLETIPQTWRI
ncbi:MAG: MBL fold metallo-hydrolase [Sphaerochaetaceae bacterium]